ncbi:MAG: flagellar biosynthesis repressor FlbT [Alphaproteobacteria bacterium]|nr:flagellar biosynthesis repressor FlbT [Alphaproteobacteria bacterium]
MTGGLVLRLRPHEKFLVNGVVIENGDRRVRLRVKTQDAHILRIRDALHPDEATTPAKRLYYAAQLVVTGEADAEQAKAEILPALDALREAFGEKLCRAELDQAVQDARAGKFYNVMRQLSRVIPQEEALLAAANARAGAVRQ